MARKGNNFAIIELEEHRGRDAKTGQKKFGVGVKRSSVWVLESAGR
jgi:hypothetical protein